MTHEGSRPPHTDKLVHSPGCSDALSSPSQCGASRLAPAGKTMDNCAPVHNYPGPEIVNNNLTSLKCCLLPKNEQKVFTRDKKDYQH